MTYISAYVAGLLQKPLKAHQPQTQKIHCATGLISFTALNQNPQKPKESERE
jgi:hypothetical protein